MSIILQKEFMEKRIEIAIRELTSLGQGWRNDWSGFDGRTLRRQLEEIVGVLNGSLEDTDVGTEQLARSDE